MSKHDLRARPIYHHKRDSIDAHLAIVFAALAITHHVEDPTGWSIKRFVRTAAATTPFRSAPAINSSPPKTRSPTTCELPWSRSHRPEVRNNLSEVRK